MPLRTFIDRVLRRAGRPWFKRPAVIYVCDRASIPTGRVEYPREFARKIAEILKES